MSLEKLTTILAVIPERGVQGVAFNKVMQLARATGAHLELFLISSLDLFTLAGRAAFDRSGPLDFTTHDGVTPLHEAVLRRLEAVGADLLVVPRAGPRLEDCPIPQLMLGDTPWASEPRFAATVDVTSRDSESLARQIMHAAGFLAQRLEAHLDVLYAEAERKDPALRMERAVKVARLVREYHVGCERLQVFEGTPERALPPLLSARHYDLLVVGTENQRVSPKLMESTGGDVLLIEAVAPRRAPVEKNSALQQLACQA